ncbi:putative spermidine/putrescine transport system substrate-binding protein [Amycolatopsis xylanica]|uniref:Putative spermidine/putrescine transport system substrate-binding protein n=1 Tax=Amycolatopsis xylanica TaxID=589385 RepID=A0A1H3NMH9_9PSEU|nr:ABC transporter substrate-binding protein [Amycolatopsis xylanica]SDY90111.1 putative spermidine/putrescine transport system substrate-binding protein [Amycolatopsis xylanica]
MNRRLAGIVAGIATVTLTLSACGGGSDAAAKDKGGAATAKSAADLGGLDKLIEAAKKEGELNVIALPHDWANYGEILEAFKKKYGLKVTEANPEGSSQDEISAVKQLKGQERAPDVLDLGGAFALSAAKDGLLAPYKVATFADVPDAQKDPEGNWVNDYGGFISIGYDAAKVPNPPKSFADLRKPEYQGKVALNGDPTKAGAAFAGVYAAALANGGSFTDIKPGIQFFADLKKSGNFIPVQASAATVESGQTPITIDWDYLQAGYAKKLQGKIDWKVAIPADGIYSNFYCQAISKTAPHPAAARLWQEFLYSDEGQNLFLKGLSRPVRLGKLTAAGTADSAALAALPEVKGEVKFPTNDQIDAAKKVIADEWAKALG